MTLNPFDVAWLARCGVAGDETTVPTRDHLAVYDTALQALDTVIKEKDAYRADWLTQRARADRLAAEATRFSNEAYRQRAINKALWLADGVLLAAVLAIAGWLT